MRSEEEKFDELTPLKMSIALLNRELKELKQRVDILEAVTDEHFKSHAKKERKRRKKK